MLVQHRTPFDKQVYTLAIVYRLSDFKTPKQT